MSNRGPAARSLDGALVCAGLLLGVGCVGGSVFIVGVHAIIWLQTAYWPPLTALSALHAIGLDIPHLSWLGAQKAVEWIAGEPFSEVLSFSGIMAAWALIASGTRYGL